MKLARVLGTVTASVHHPAYDAQTLLLCEPLSPDGTSAGEPFIAVDRAQAGTGDRVLVNQEGNGARQVFGLKPKDKLPIRSVIVGVVDDASEPEEASR
ncbi:MAG: EutN/CcmL family microcompartment protein [Deltaproteobacteria bacterium]|nr:EutN/CcmL family microcompartment protein [Deltaproteobacteria bacterium]